MPTYEVHFRDRGGQIHEAEEFDARDDVDAVTQAHALYQDSGRYGFVLMRDTRIILQHHPRRTKIKSE